MAKARTQTAVEAMFISDLQWTEKPPIARSVEGDWLAVQKSYIDQLRELWETLGGPPIFMAGDLFDKWDSSPHLIGNVLNWIRGLPIYAIPGNHDLPQHNYKELPKSAYWVLVEAGAIKHLTPGGSRGIDVGTIAPESSYGVGTVNIHPFPYGFEVKPPVEDNGLTTQIALIHGYIWTEKTGHKDASSNLRYGRWMKKLQGYDLAVFGDNHCPWLIRGKCTVLNCGTFMRRHSNEKDYKPCIGLLYTNGVVKRHLLDTAADKWLDVKDIVEPLQSTLNLELEDMIEELTANQTERVVYSKIILQWMDINEIPERVRAIMLRCLGVRK